MRPHLHASRERAFGRSGRADEDGSQHPRVESRLRSRTGPGKHPPARVIEHAHHQNEKGGEDDERDRRRLRVRDEPITRIEQEQVVSYAAFLLPGTG